VSAAEFAGAVDDLIESLKRRRRESLGLLEPPARRHCSRRVKPAREAGLALRIKLSLSADARFHVRFLVDALSQALAK
jgi:hypothetical protein